jgi:hypothetical protein
MDKVRKSSQEKCKTNSRTMIMKRFKLFTKKDVREKERTGDQTMG